MLLDILNHSRIKVTRVYSPTVDPSRHIFNNIPCFTNEDEILEENKENVLLVNGVGVIPGSSLRWKLGEKFKSHGFKFLNVIAQSAEISPHVTLGEGVQILNGAIVQAGASICDDSILNTRTLVEHDCNIGPMNHIAPGATLCGGVTTGSNVFIGAGSVILPKSIIESGSIVKANSLLKN